MVNFTAAKADGLSLAFGVASVADIADLDHGRALREAALKYWPSVERDKPMADIFPFLRNKNA